MTYFNRKLMKRDIPASATVEGALVIPVILYAVAAVSYTHLTLPTNSLV